MKYPYTASEQANTDGRPTKRPVLEVTLSHGRERRKFLALLDSGADQITMPSAIAEILGIDRESCPERTAMGITMEPISGFVGQVTLQLAHQPEPFEAPVVFVDAEMPVLLGRERLFDHYRIKFEQDHDIFEVTAVR